jgi:putative GTP pyrophosphokinase
VALPSRREINRCGDLLRSFLNALSAEGFILEQDDGGEWDWAELNRALDVIAEFRSTFSYPLAKVSKGLRAMVSAETSELPVVAQRLKRMDRILGKLVRMPSMNVAQLEDIGGCRAVFQTDAQLRATEARIRRRWDIAREHDYIREPKPSGYRAVHLVVRRDGRPVEIQLRTDGQQQWADAVESIASFYDLPLKDEQGPPEVLNYFKIAGEGIYGDEYGVADSEDLLARWTAARETMREWMAQHRPGGR